MAQTVLITGASTGIGKATARFFREHGWNVVATMRAPDKETELNTLDDVLVTRLDVTDGASIDEAVERGIARFGRIDALVNNAGYGAFGPLESFPMENIRRQFDTNVIGLLETTKGLLPHFRANRSGVIVNISSVAGRMAFPLGSLYHGTKFAVEGISEALQYELRSIGVRIKVVEPGAIETDFGGRSFDFTNDESIEEYQHTVGAVMSFMESVTGDASPARDVAQVIWDATHDETDKLRFPAAGGAENFLAGRAAATDEAFFAGVRDQFKL
ncbi:MAG: SDR family oxidoreductase [Planctomycetota bacterium]